MKKRLAFLTVTLLAVASVAACNKQKAPRLDYTEKMKKGLFSPNGLPGENHVGATDEEKKFQGYESQAKAASTQEKKSESKDVKPAPKEEKKPEAKDVKPAPKEEKKPEVRDVKPAPKEEKKPESRDVKPAPKQVEGTK